MGHTLAAFGISGVLGALLTSMLNSKHSTLKLANVVAALFGLTLVFVTLTRSLIQLTCLLFPAGMAMAIIGTTVNSTLQRFSKNNFRGKVVSLFQLSMQGGIAIGGLLMGFSSSKLGIENILSHTLNMVFTKLKSNTNVQLLLNEC